MSQICPPISIRELLKKNLSIPNYQRPYKWKEKNALDLIADIDHERRKDIPQDSGYRYRIGSIILHEEGEVVNIVDGQQRLLTIGLILLETNPVKLKDVGLFNKPFTDITTLDNLSYNREQIGKFFKNWDKSEKRAFAKYLLEGCEMIVVRASNIAEAFQLFDSQNARGKSLDPADLLKAYHLRSMVDEHEKRMCVKRWEEAIDQKLLYHVLSRIIYRCRRWMRRDYSAYEFGNGVINEFKGVDVDIFNKRTTAILPYMQRLYVTSQMNSYCIDEPISNGKRFFDYVDHYVAVYKRLFPGIEDFSTNRGGERLKQDNDFQDMVRRNCFYSPKMYRTGDGRLRNVLYCLLVSYYDKFGKEGYEEFFKIAYQYVYQIRFELRAIQRESIRDYVLYGYVPGGNQRMGNSINLFEWISESYQAYPTELRTLLRLEKEFCVENLNTNVRE